MNEFWDFSHNFTRWNRAKSIVVTPMQGCERPQCTGSPRIEMTTDQSCVISPSVFFDSDCMSICTQRCGAQCERSFWSYVIQCAVPEASWLLPLLGRVEFADRISSSSMAERYLLSILWPFVQPRTFGVRSEHSTWESSLSQMTIDMSPFENSSPSFHEWSVQIEFRSNSPTAHLEMGHLMDFTIFTDRV